MIAMMDMYRCYLKELPFFNTQNLPEETISTNDQTIQNNVHSEALETNRNPLSNTQSMSSTFDDIPSNALPLTLKTKKN